MYKHVLVAVDLSEESPVLLKKRLGLQNAMKQNFLSSTLM